MAEDWWSIEIFNARTSAAQWRDAHAESLIESAVTNGALSWEWHAHSWGVVLEVRFRAERQWEAWRRLPGTQAALDSVPDPVNGLLVHRGHGGASGDSCPRRPRITPSAGAVELPEPDDLDLGLAPLYNAAQSADGLPAMASATPR
ncbi:hypothetical protein QMK19_06995 [Streptomyces sp. H10-C2]|uniref:hypothetical protein n=1 Tax=unclassified Streptomyces TaxID=2593676 RepID=UPI0024BB4865|nr:MULTISPECIES: hypothetical protein [unclassified Streptomyces]MDJ0341222.1 hypothetical protein [Streptomyces sp. PH10-H1]MDJ0369425.1 hypothetical protein [Streptomyces sp. H10-C2]